ncbi:uncharacterized protein [Periplaneta americana]|uniref:uncharacterized protein n=1 Tax=Periplaneta americana TaxID=6978 RepID=UPI0037E710D2
MDSDSSSQGSSDDSDISSRKKKKKLMFIYPDRLGALALEVLGKHVSQLMITLYTGKKYLTLPDLLKVCRQMEKIVQFPLPPPLLNELTATLMEHACNTWCDLNRSSDLQPRVETWDPELYKQSWNLKNVLKIASSKARKHLQKKRNLGEEYFLEILSAIINPSITLFDCSLQTLFDCPPYNADILERLSKKFNNLKILRLGRRNVDRDSLFESVKHMGNLEEFACQTTWDGLLVSLSIYCKKLKVLDLNNAEIVTDACVDYITRFKYLEVLDLTATDVSHNGFRSILKGISDNECCENTTLHTLKLDEKKINVSNINLLVANFPNIQSLSLTNFNCRLVSLRGLKQLTELSLDIWNFRDEMSVAFANELLQAIGGQLLTLRLSLSIGTDLSFISKKCCALRTLALKFRTASSVNRTVGLSFMDYSRMFPLQEVKSVEFLEVSMYDTALLDHIVSRFVNVKKISIECEASDSLICTLFQKLARGNLKEIHLCGNWKVDPSGKFALVTKWDMDKKKYATYSTNLQDLKGGRILRLLWL